jgi:hypothetical protein
MGQRCIRQSFLHSPVSPWGEYRHLMKVRAKPRPELAPFALSLRTLRRSWNERHPFESRPMTQERLAEELGVDVRSVRDWEGGRRAPRTVDRLGEICDLLEAPREALALSLTTTGQWVRPMLASPTFEPMEIVVDGDGRMWGASTEGQILLGRVSPCVAAHIATELDRARHVHGGQSSPESLEGSQDGARLPVTTDDLPSDDRLAGILGTWDGVSTMAAAEESAAFGAWAEVTNIGPTTLEQFDSDIRQIAHTYLHTPPLPLFLRTLRLRDRAFALLQGRQHPDQTRHLYATAGWLCSLLAWMSGDLGDYTAAKTHGRIAWLCAELADHNGLRAWTRATQSKLAFWNGEILESEHLARDGLRFATATTAAVMLRSLEGRASARLGNSETANSAIHQAREAREHVTSPDEVGGLFGCSMAQQSYLAGSTYLWLRQPGDALREAEDAIQHFETSAAEDRFYGAEMLARIDAMTAHAQEGRLDSVEGAAQVVLAVPPQQRLDTFVRGLHRVRDELGRPAFQGSVEARQLQEQIEDFCAGAIARDCVRDG